MKIHITIDDSSVEFAKNPILETQFILLNAASTMMDNPENGIPYMLKNRKGEPAGSITVNTPNIRFDRNVETFNVIALIKMIRMNFGLGLAEAKKVVDVGFLPPEYQTPEIVKYITDSGARIL